MLDDTAEKVELEFSYNEINVMDSSDTSKDILRHVRKHGDIGPGDCHYDLSKITEFRKLPRA